MSDALYDLIGGRETVWAATEAFYRRVLADDMLKLQKKGCSEGQGYFFCHPIIAGQFAEFLQSGLRQSVVH
jgi:hypothetical protein